MRDRHRARFQRARSAALLATALLALPAWAAFDLDALTHLLAQRKSAQARFTEERFVSGIDGPLRASGTLSFTAPDHFVRQTLEPLAESMSVDGNTVTLKRGGRVRQMALDAVPELTALIDAVRATLERRRGQAAQAFHRPRRGRPGAVDADADAAALRSSASRCSS